MHSAVEMVLPLLALSMAPPRRQVASVDAFGDDSDDPESLESGLNDDGEELQADNELYWSMDDVMGGPQNQLGNLETLDDSELNRIEALADDIEEDGDIVSSEAAYVETDDPGGLEGVEAGDASVPYDEQSEDADTPTEGQEQNSEVQGEDQEPEESPDGGRSASQLAEMPIENDDAERLSKRPRRGGQSALEELQTLRDEVVAILRDARSAEGRLSQLLRSRANQARRGLESFEPTRRVVRLLSALAELLVSADTPVGAASNSGPTRIIGRASQMLGGIETQFYLVLHPRGAKRFVWYTDTMQSTEDLKEAWDAYEGPKGSDPSGRGWVVRITAVSGTRQRRRYVCLWTIEEGARVPINIATHGWSYRSLFVNTQIPDDWESVQDESDGQPSGGPSGGPGGDPGPSDGDGPNDDDPGDEERDPVADDDNAFNPRSAITWDIKGTFKIDLAAAIYLHADSTDDLVGCLIEYTLSRIWALESQVPPESIADGSPTQSEIERLGKHLFEINELEETSNWEKQRPVRTVHRCPRKTQQNATFLT